MARPTAARASLIFSVGVIFSGRLARSAFRVSGATDHLLIGKTRALAAGKVVISAPGEMQALMKPLGITYDGDADPIELERKPGVDLR